MSTQNCRVGRKYYDPTWHSPTPFGENTSMRMEIIDMSQYQGPNKLMMFGTGGDLPPDENWEKVFYNPKAEI